MKRLHLLVVALLITLCCNAQDYKVFTTENDETVIKGVLESKRTASDIFKNASNWAITMSHEGSIDKDSDAGIITINGSIQSKSAYNPFTGTYTDIFGYTCKLTIVDNKLSYEFVNLLLTKKYAGFGTSSKEFVVAEMIDEVLNVGSYKAEIEDDNSLSKKEKKDEIKKLEGEVESFEVSLEKIESVVVKKIEALNNRIK